MAASKPRLNPGIAVCDIDGEKVLYDERRRQLHSLNHSASLVVDLCDGRSTVKEMAEAIADVYEMPIDEVHQQVRLAVRQLRKAGILAPTTRTARGKGNVTADRAGEVATDGSIPAAAPEDGVDGRELVRMEVPRST